MREARAGISGIERDIGAAGLEDAEHRDDHRRAAIEADGDRRIGGDVELDQVAREAVGARVEFGVREALAAGDQRGGLGRTPDLRLEQPVQILVPVIRRVRRVQCVDQQRSLVVGHDLQMLERTGSRLERIRQLLQRTLHVGADPFRQRR
ncbi:hypothetical protein BLA6860_01959 [Burkholderia lata]|nr:hypothetical protein BLA6860_01959 [Burkholderia lata]